MSLSRLASLACIVAAAILPSSAGTADELATDRPAGDIEAVATFYGPMPTGVAVSHSGASSSVSGVGRSGATSRSPRSRTGDRSPTPMTAINLAKGGPAADRLISGEVGGAAAADRLSMVDTGSIEFGSNLARRSEARRSQPWDESGLQDDHLPAGGRPADVVPQRCPLRPPRRGGIRVPHRFVGQGAQWHYRRRSGHRGRWRRLHDHPTTKAGLTHQNSRGFGPVHSIDSRSSIPPRGGVSRYSCPCCSSPP